ncbi:MAG: Hsp20/alpha crystallin family protein [Salinivirgaceae bacterium]|jgi:HSP20 family protein|nr:Hsp20/alpha crystallin family protein [Salinivirgaceae bacterium]
MEGTVRSLVKFSNSYSDLFDHFFDNNMFDWSDKKLSNTSTTIPLVNVKEYKDGYSVELAAPGLKKDDFKVELNNDILTISSEKRIENEENNGHQFTKKEFSYQSFNRSFALPSKVNSGKIKAKYENGILIVSLPKKEEAKPRPVKQIAIS